MKSTSNPSDGISFRFVLLIFAVFVVGRLLIMYYMPLMDPSEARYAVIAKNMAESQNYLEPQFVYDGQLQNFEGKPALTFQMGAIACKAGGISAFSTRIPALMAAVIILISTYLYVKKRCDKSTAGLAAMLTISSFFFYFYAGLMMTDLILTASVVLAVYCYSLFLSADSIPEKKWWSIGFFACLSAGMIIKGPVAIVMAGLPVFFYTLINNKWAELRYHSWVFGSIVFLLISVPWYYMMTLKNPDFLYYFFVNENFKRFLFRDYGDKFGCGRETFRGMALVWLGLVNLPMIFTLPTFSKQIREQFYQRKLFSDPVTGLSALGVITITGFWCLTSRCLITYLLPTIPFLAVFIAVRYCDIKELDNKVFIRSICRFITFCTILFPIGMLAATVIAQNHAPELSGKTFVCIQKTIQDNPKLKDKRLYFSEITPYSADFYCSSQLKNHPNESVQESLENSKNDILIIKSKTLSGKTELPGRKRILQSGPWLVFQPSDP